MLELADIFRLYGPQYRALYQDRMLPSHKRAMSDIEHCRTEVMGGHVFVCTDCAVLRYSYHSCKNRNCPKCRNEESEQWLEKQRQLLLPVRYFLVSFTIPKQLRDLTRSHQKIVYPLLFKTSAAALQKLALDPHFLGGYIGMVGVLHTWARNLSYHPHVHYIVPAGGINDDGTLWLPARYKNYLVPAEALSVIFRAKFRDEMKKQGLKKLVDEDIWNRPWVVHSEPVGNGEHALEYLAPYVYRVALTNKQLCSLKDDKVTFRYRDSKKKKWRYVTIGALKFISLFLQHVLPKG
ncbi:transposase, partial [candidate division CSSED10-310 bacterium]